MDNQDLPKHDQCLQLQLWNVTRFTNTRKRRGVKSIVEKVSARGETAPQLLEGPSLSCSVCTTVEALELPSWGKFKKGWSARAMHQILKAGTWLTSSQHP